MLFLGGTKAAHCSLTWELNARKVNGPERGFCGYKLDSMSGDNGIFAEWHIDNDTLTLSNDRYGMFPMYYTITPNGIDFSSSIIDLLKENHPLDDAALAVFLRTGFFIADTTPFSTIKALPPGTTLHCRRGKTLLQTRQFAPELNTAVSLHEAHDIYGELFHASISKFRQTFSGKVAVPLSGGRDSRHILFELRAAGCTPVSCLTMKYPPPNANADAAIAGSVAEHLHAHHVVLEPYASLLGMEKEKNIHTNFCSLEHAWILPLAHYLSKKGYRAAFDGIGGDVLSAGLFLTPERLDLYRREKYEELANTILWPDGHLPVLLTKSSCKRFNRDSAIARLVEALRIHARAPNPVGQFFFWNRTRRHIALCCWGILQQNTHVFAPYLETSVYDFLSSLPAEYFLDHSFHQDSIAKRFPKYAHLPYAPKTTQPQKGGFVSNVLQTFELLLYFLRAFTKRSMCRPSFLYTRLVKSLLWNESKGRYRIPIYLSQLSRYL